MVRRFLLVGGDSACPTARLLAPSSKSVVGRSSKCEINIAHPTVSRRHGLLLVQPNAISVIDLESYNGTFVDDKRITEATVHDGQCIRFGDVTFMLSLRELSGDEVDISSLETADSVGPRGRVTLGNGQSLISPAQHKVFDQLLKGLADKEIGSKLGLSHHTVHNHVKAIFEAYRVHSRHELFVKIFRAQE